MLDAECLPISLCARTRTRALSNLKLHHVPRTLRTCIHACQAPEGKPVLAVARRLIRHGHRGLQERNIVSDADEGGIKDRCWARHLLSGLAREGRHHIMIIDHFGCSPTRQIYFNFNPTIHATSPPRAVARGFSPLWKNMFSYYRDRLGLSCVYRFVA